MTKTTSRKKVTTRKGQTTAKATKAKTAKAKTAKAETAKAKTAKAKTSKSRRPTLDFTQAPLFGGAPTAAASSAPSAEPSGAEPVKAIYLRETLWWLLREHCAKQRPPIKLTEKADEVFTAYLETVGVTVPPRPLRKNARPPRRNGQLAAASEE